MQPIGNTKPTTDYLAMGLIVSLLFTARFELTNWKCSRAATHSTTTFDLTNKCMYRWRLKDSEWHGCW